MTELGLDLSARTILQNVPVTPAGKLTRHPETSMSLVGRSIGLEVLDPDGNALPCGSPDLPCATLTIDDDGHYEFPPLDVFTQKGRYSVRTWFEETPILTSAEATAHIDVGTAAGYAVIVQGKVEPLSPGGESEGLDSHNKTTNRIYDSLVSRGFDPNNIRYFNYDASQDGVYQVPSKSEIQASVTGWMPDRVNGSPAPMYIIMVDHGLPNQFFVSDDSSTATDDDVISPAELGQWIDALEAGLTGSARLEPRVVVYGACFSGSFLPALSGKNEVLPPDAPNRLIITSAASDEESYKGPDEGDAVRAGEYFIEELFKDLESGHTFERAFKDATLRTETFTRKGGTGNAESPYFDNAIQHPLLDDNGDAVGDNLLSQLGGDGGLAKKLVLGSSLQLATNSPLGSASILAVTEAIRLDEGDCASSGDYETCTAVLWATTSNESRVLSAWLELRDPAATLQAPAANSSYQLTHSLERHLLGIKPERQRREVSLSQLTVPGIYEAFYYVRDANNLSLSHPRRSLIYKGKVGNLAPSAPMLVSPGDETQQKSTLVFNWSDSTDPEGDPFTYSLTIATDPDFGQVVHRQAELNASSTFVDQTTKLKNLVPHYWKVQAIDQYGAVGESAVRSFTPNDTNGPDAIIHGLLISDQNAAAVAGALVSSAAESSLSELGGQFVLSVLPGSVDLEVTGADGHMDRQITGITLRPGETVEANIQLIADSEPDGLPDAWEIEKFGDLAQIASDDPDNDDLSNLEEFKKGTGPKNGDTDDDQMPDGWEVGNQLDPLVADATDDPDNDDLSNLEEFKQETDPKNGDTDDDQMPDGWEVGNQLDPLVPDATDDPDGDGYDNLSEYRAGSDPNDGNSTPATMILPIIVNFILD